MNSQIPGQPAPESPDNPSARAPDDIPQDEITTSFREEERLFRRAIEEAPIPMIVHAEDGMVLQISRSWTEMTGYILADVPTFDAWLNYAYGEGAAVVREHIRDLFAGNQRTLNVAFDIRTRTGELRHWSFSASAPGMLYDGRRFVVGMAVDITERTRTERALAEQARLLDLSNDAIIVRDVNSRIVYWNRGATELYGWTREEALGQDLHTLLQTEFEAPFPELVARLYEHDRQEGEVVQVTRDGRRITLLCRWALDRDAAGQPASILTTYNDITARKRAETVLRESEQRFRLLVTTSSYTIYQMSPDWREMRNLQGWNFLASTNEPSESWLDAYIPLVEQPRVLAAIQEAIHTRSMFELEHRVVRKDGTVGWTLSRAVPLLDAQGEIVEWFGAASDITERKQAEEQRRALDRALLETQKLESLGVLAGGIAHDFNNMLVAMLGNADLALLDLAVDHPATTSVMQIQMAARRAAELTGQLLAYSGRGRFVVGPLDLAQIVQEMMALLRVSIPHTVTIDYVLPTAVPLVEGDASQLRQVVMNLVINAAEAVGDRGGAVRVRIEPRTIDAAYLSSCVVENDAPPGRYLALEVTDTGLGMDEATQRRIFEPFFTTKFTGRGLGLAAVQGVVRAHHGAIHVASIPGRGTTITVLLPHAAEQTAALSPVTAPQQLVATTTRHLLLVIDDEPDVRQVATRMLERLGYRTLTAQDGEAGLALLDAEPTISGVLLDLTMPGLSGEETFQRLRQRRPGLPVVIVSGYSEQEVRGRLGGAEAVDVIQKPFDSATLRQVLAGLLITHQ